MLMTNISEMVSPRRRVFREDLSFGWMRTITLRRFAVMPTIRRKSIPMPWKRKSMGVFVGKVEVLEELMQLEVDVVFGRLRLVNKMSSIF